MKESIAFLHNSDLTDEQYLLFETISDISEVFAEDTGIMIASHQILDRGSWYDKIFFVKKHDSESTKSCLDNAFDKHKFGAILLLNGENSEILKSNSWAYENNNYLYSI